MTRPDVAIRPDVRRAGRCCWLHGTWAAWLIVATALPADAAPAAASFEPSGPAAPAGAAVTVAATQEWISWPARPRSHALDENRERKRGVDAARGEGLTRAAVLQLAESCAPTAPATTLANIVAVESGFDPLVLRVNGRVGRVYRPRSAAAAEQLAADLIDTGANVDLGLAQINSRNLTRLGLSVKSAFDPCASLAAAAVILNDGYGRALATRGSGRPLLQTAYSIYNTGNQVRGFANGYAQKIVAVARSTSSNALAR